jgi:hypothetical protein
VQGMQVSALSNCQHWVSLVSWQPGTRIRQEKKFLC